MIEAPILDITPVINPEDTEKSTMERIKELFGPIFNSEEVRIAVIDGVRNSKIVDFYNINDSIDIEKPKRLGVSASPLVQDVLTNIKELKDILNGVGIGNLDGKSHSKPEEINYLLQRFKNKILVDIGAGANTGGYKVAQMLGASGYIAVEPNSAENLNARFASNAVIVKTSDTDQDLINKTIPYVIIQSDGLTFLKSLTDGSVNLMLVATDDYMFPDEQYNKKFNSEASRVVGQTGVALEHDSCVGLKKENTSGMFFNNGNGKTELTGMIRDDEIKYK